MYLLTYSFHGLGTTVYHHMAYTADPVGWLIRKRRDDPTVCIVWLRELSPQERRRLDELRAAGVEVEGDA